nr:MAG TPA: hypothetical protein [Caudoviricetes sp.]DAM73014.1 MAG TPA: hypothetical protein [Caudoviricetes sp.]
MFALPPVVQEIHINATNVNISGKKERTINPL